MLEDTIFEDDIDEEKPKIPASDADEDDLSTFDNPLLEEIE